MQHSAGHSKVRNIGSGPGKQTLDGCSVDFYLRLPPGDEVSKVIDASPPPKSLLELGSGCGRLTRPLIDAGYAVIAVDNSPDMLSFIDYADTVVSDIESFRLAQVFDVVLLASRVFNCPDGAVRDQMVRTAREHIAEGGVFLLEIHSPSILNLEAGESSTTEHYSAKILSSETNGTRASVTIEYSIDDDTWRHSFETVYLSPAEVETTLRRHGFEIAGWLDSERSWAKAVAA